MKALERESNSNDVMVGKLVEKLVCLVVPTVVPISLFMIVAELTLVLRRVMP